MKIVENHLELIIGNTYYIYIPETHRSKYIINEPIKVRAKLINNKNNKLIFDNVEYINNHYEHLKFPQGKPIFLILYIYNNNFYRIVNQYLSDILKFKNKSKIYIPQKENILTNFILRNSIIGDPYFNYNL